MYNIRDLWLSRGYKNSRLKQNYGLYTTYEYYQQGRVTVRTIQQATYQNGGNDHFMCTLFMSVLYRTTVCSEVYSILTELDHTVQVW